MSSPRSQRRDKRYAVELKMTLKQGSRAVELVTDNVSYRGLFVRTSTPPPLRQLVKLEAQLPPGNRPFTTHGMTVYVIAPGDPQGRPAGAGIQFYGMGDERRAWEAFINGYIKPLAEGTDQKPAVTGQVSGAVEPARRESAPMLTVSTPDLGSAARKGS